MEKQELLREFSSDPDRHYRVAMFAERGFERRACASCGRFFWSSDPGRDRCPEDSADAYSFIGDPPAPRRLDYNAAWREVEGFFSANGHASVPRYPVVCRWRDDLYFTIASIVDFQRVMGSRVVFEFPANPLVVPQTCLRFKDLENVGVTGRHFSSFCMVGQHSAPDAGGYWKDECVDLDYRLLTERLGLPGREVTFVEDVWAGGGSFGPSLEYFVRGLELGNAVFTEFQGGPSSRRPLDQRVIDMGAGLERFAWVTAGTPTAYDCCFGPVLGRLFELAGADPDSPEAAAYFAAVARRAGGPGGLAEDRRLAAADAGLDGGRLESLVAPMEGAYLVADHLRTLAFAISDGALPSNVGGGYNLRVMLRRVLAAMGRMGMSGRLDELVDLHADYLSATYPEIGERRGDVKEILGIEAARYGQSLERMGKIAARLAARPEPPGAPELLTLYESDGVTPDYLLELGAIREVPPDFYSRLSELHQSRRPAAPERLPLDGLPDTEALFYGGDPPEFTARVLRVMGARVVLDRTSFYARGGGQEPDRGTIGGLRVRDVSRHGGVIVHELEGGAPEEGSEVRCSVDRARRAAITRNHTGTHILNSSAREALGSWVWQHSAFKDADHARLDVTHHSPLTAADVRRIERRANEVVGADMPVTVREHERGEAERRYGFRIYQGGVVPVRSVRIVSVGDFDVEACGGTHVKGTAEVGPLRITRTKRIQDGVVRIEFVTGDAARAHDEAAARERAGREAAEGARAERDRLRAERRRLDAERVPRLLAEVAAVAGAATVGGIEVDATGPGRLCFTESPEYDERFHAEFGRRLARADPGAVYCAVFAAGPSVRVVAAAGAGAPPGRGADAIARAASELLGGSGGGDASFAQGGGRETSNRAAAAARARSMVMGR